MIIAAPLTIAFAGTGSIGQRHIRNLLAQTPDAQTIFLRADKRVDALSTDIKARVVATIDELLALKPDGVIISTPSSLHAQTLLPIIKANIPVFVEKPVVTTAQDIDALQKAIDDHPKLPSLIGCNLRFLPSLQIMRQMVKHGEIGTIARASFEAGQWLPDWRPTQDHRQSYSAKPDHGGGVVFDLLHEIDAAEWMCGPLELKSCQTGHLKSLEIESESVAYLLLRGKTNENIAHSLPLVSVGVDYVSRKPLRQYRLIGDEGSLTWSLSAASLTLETKAGVREIDCGAYGFDMGKTYETAMTEFLTALNGGPQTSNPIQTGLSSNMLALTAKNLSC